MSGYYPHSGETNPLQIARGVRDALDGRSNAFGEFTLEADETETVVVAPNCSPESCISLMPLTEDAAGEIAAGTLWIAAASVVAGQFTVTHANDPSETRTFRYAIQG